MGSKSASLLLLVLAELAGMSLWFTSAAVLPEMVAEGAVSPFRQALLSSGVQIGFVVGALTFAVLGLADRYDPRRVIAISGLLAAAANLALIAAPIGSDPAIAARFVTGAMLAGVYPVGMKIAVGWGLKDRGLLVGLVVGALTFGNSVPFVIAAFGGAEWRITVIAVSVLAALGSVLVLAVSLGPHHARAATFDPGAIGIAWTNRKVRAAILGYLGHMWELYVMWAWVGAATAASYAATMAVGEADALGRLTAFVAIAGGAVTCVLAGALADRIGKAEVAIGAMVASGASAVLIALTFGGPPAVTFVIAVIWGLAVIPDSAQFSALVADHAPPDKAGSILTFQTAIGFALTFVTVQATPLAAGALGWPVVLAALAIGPALGILAMLPLRRGR
jgi:MFS family permease